MTAGPPDHFALYALATGIVLGLLAIGAGVAGLVRGALALRKRLEGYKRLPFAPALTVAQVRVDTLSRRLDGLPAILGRLERAVNDITAARTSVVRSAATVRATVAAFFTPR